MEIGIVPDALMPRVADLFSFAFELRKSGTWEEWLKGEDTLTRYGAFEGDQLYALICVHDFETHIANQWVPCAGIAGVVSNPARRGQGLLRRVMEHCLSHLNERGVPLAVLGTDIPLFYEKMGFAYCDWQVEIEVSTSALSKFRALGDSSNYKMIDSKQMVRCKDVHDRWSDMYNLSIRRTVNRWNRENFGWECAWQVFLHQDGYMLIDLTASKEKNRLSVFEWACVTEQAYLDGLALLSRCDADYSTVRWTEKSAERLFNYGSLDQCPKVTLSPGQMARVVNLDTYAKIFGRSFDSVVIKDPLQVTETRGGESVSNTVALSPGQLVQLTTGFWKQLPQGWPAEHERIAGPAPTFISEIF
ncbi:MAG: GNAT family N-acetyltransferase [Candidatus Obscuribacterales bacterium]|jgi:predicted acetyltransferase|nr:GNAT family N-acetyltransferase [Candidatus Obscuribacterales bacterium]